MPRDVVVVGGSAGALSPPRPMLRESRGDFPAAFCAVIPTPPPTPAALPTPLETEIRVRVTRGPRENGVRPGAQGLALVRHHGGSAVLQDPAVASIGAMPRSAIEHVDVDHVAKADDTPALLPRLVSAATPADGRDPGRNPGNELAEEGLHGLTTDARPSPHSPFTSPECGGSLRELTNGAEMRAPCHVGHTHRPEALAHGMRENPERRADIVRSRFAQRADFARASLTARPPGL